MRMVANKARQNNRRGKFISKEATHTMQKSIRLLHERIDYVLKWNGIIFISANIIFLVLFILMNFLNLQNSSAVWRKFLLDRLVQTENIVENGDQVSSIPVIHTLVIASDGTIQKSSAPILQGMRLNNSGFFGKIVHLQPGQNAIVFFPDMVDGVQRVHFVKRIADEFIVKSFEPNNFFPISLAGETNLSVVTGGVTWYSNDPKQIGEMHRKQPIYLDSGRLFLVFSDQIPEMAEASLVITQDITNPMQIQILTAAILMLVFGVGTWWTMNVQKDFTILRDEHKGITLFIQTLSTMILHPDENLPTRLENLVPVLHQSFQNTQNTALQFEENQQYWQLVQKLAEDILLLVKTVEEDGAKLRESEARFRAVVEHSSNGVVFMSAEREIDYVSPTYPKYLGYTPQEMLGHFGMEFTHPEDLAATTKAFNELIQTPADIVTVEYRLQRKDGSYCWVETTAVNLLADPYVRAVVLNQRDITERKQAEVAQHDSEERYRTLAEATFEAIVITENGLIPVHSLKK